MRLLLIPITASATILLLWLARPVLIPILFAMLLAQLLSPLVNRFERRLPALLAVVLGMSMMALVVGGTAALIGTQLSALQTKLPTIGARVALAVESFALEIGHYFGFAGLSKRLLATTGIEDYLGSGGAAAFSALTFTIATLGEFILVVILAFLMIYYRRHFRRQLKILGENAGTHVAGAAIDRTAELGQAYVAGLTTVMVLVAVLDTVGLLLVGSPFPALFGLLGALAVLIPYVGFAIVAPTCTVLAWLATGSAPLAGGVLLVFCVVHFLEGNLISPVLVGSKVNLNPLATIIAVLVGGRLWGPAGMALFIPLTGLLKLTLDSMPQAVPLARLLGPVTDQDIGRKRPRRSMIALVKARWETGP